MAEPWLTLIGIGEDGRDGLSAAAVAALDAAEAVWGAPRHLALAGVAGEVWPVPFDAAPVLARRGRPTVVLVSGDPFWHGAGATLAAALEPGEWRAFPAPSTFVLAAARLGWRIEETACLGLHAAPFDRLRPHLGPGARAIVLLRDGEAPGALAAWLAGQGFGDSRLWVMERLGGPAERVRAVTAAGFDLGVTEAPVAAAILADGPALRRGPGLPDDAFAHDGQITRAAVRALTLAALAPAPGAVLWDLGAGSGSVSVEWALAGGRAVAVERRADRCANIRANLAAFGVAERVTLVEGDHAALPEGRPDAVFLGGGASSGLIETLRASAPDARLVANAVTLEAEALLAAAHARHGGRLLRIELAEAAPLGSLTGWQPQRPIVQWSWEPPR